MSKDNFFVKHKSFFIIFIVLLFSNIFFLVNTGIYWDDWVSFDYLGKEPEVGRFKILSFLDYYRTSPVIVRGILFLSDIISAFFLYLILCKEKCVKDYAVYIVLICHTLPIYLAKYTFCCADYYFSLFFFYFASYIYLELQRNPDCKFLKRIIIILISSLLYIKSFQTASLFVFYIVPFIYGYYLMYGTNGFVIDNSFLKKIFSYLKKNCIFLLLPFVMYLAKSIFFKPDENYTDYYTIHFSNIIKSPFLYINDLSVFITQLFQLNYSLVFHISDYCFFFVFLYICYIFISKKKKKSYAYISEYNSFYIFIISLLMGFFGTFAYSSLGFVGNVLSWESRHFLLLGLPLSLFLFSIMQLLCTEKEETRINISKLKSCLTITIILFSMDTIFIGYNMYKENIQEDYLINELSQTKEVEENQIFIISNNNQKVLKDLTRFYDYCGYAYKAYGTRSHLIVSSEDVDKIPMYLEIKDIIDYKTKDVSVSYVQGRIDYSVNLSLRNVIKAFIYKNLVKDKYNMMLNKIGDFKVTLY